MKLGPIQIPRRPKNLRVEGFAVDHPRFAADASSGLIEIFDGIGEGGTTPSRISAALRSIGSKRAVIEINSPGGSIWDALAIYNMLRAHTGGCTTRVMGLAASAGSVVAQAGDVREMATASQLMLHRCQGTAMGDGDVMREVAAVLDEVDRTMADLYSTRSGLARDEVVRLMAEESFVSAQDAIGLGLADTLIARDAAPPPRLAASTRPATKRELEELYRSVGYSRAIAARMTEAAWPAAHHGGEPEPESTRHLETIVDVVADAVAAALTSRTS